MRYLEEVSYILLELEGEPELITDQLIEIYRSREIKYPKFFKMNLLCKLGFIACDLLLEKCPDVLTAESNEVATIFFNKHASLASDHFHQHSLETGELPSPAVFVYTLPNILNGELSIRYGWSSYNAFFVMNAKEEAEHIPEQAYFSQPFKYCISGWVDTDLPNHQAIANLKVYKAINHP